MKLCRNVQHATRPTTLGWMGFPLIKRDFQDERSALLSLQAENQEQLEAVKQEAGSRPGRGGRGELNPGEVICRAVNQHPLLNRTAAQSRHGWHDGNSGAKGALYMRPPMPVVRAAS